MKSNNDLVKDIRDKIVFVTAIAIFFLPFMYSAFRAVEMNDAKSNSEVLPWGVGIAFYILIYFFVGMVNEKTNTRWLDWIRGFIVAGTIAFVIPIFCEALYYNKPLPAYIYWPFLISIGAMALLPLLTFILVLGCLYLEIIRNIVLIMIKKIKHKKTIRLQ